MAGGFPLELLLAEKARREEKARAAKTAASGFTAKFRELAERLRAEYHPKQRAFCLSRAKRKAGKCTRRAGKSRGALRETFARCLDGRQRWVYCNATRAEAERIAWRSDTRDGWRDLIEQLGLRVAKSRDEFDRNPLTDVLINESKLTIDLRNGSQLAIFAADRAEDADKLRGGEKDGVWVDEAQKFPALTYFVNEVVTPLLAKPGGEGGELWLTGTPARSLSGMFYDATREAEQGPRANGWEVHEWSVVDNPYYGRTPAERWANTAGAELELKGWNLADPPPQFIREWGTPDGPARWVTTDALYVYAVHAKPPVEFAPVRVDDDGHYDHDAAMRDLPAFVTNERGQQEEILWYFALGVDFGFTDPFAWSLWAFGPQIAEIYEMGSWARVGLITDTVRERLRHLWKAVGHALVVFRADAGGAMAKSSIVGWREAMGMPIEEAEKHGKETWIDLLNGEIYAGRVLFRQSSAVLLEMRELQYRVLASGRREIWKNRVSSDGEARGDHLSDSFRYAYTDLVQRRIEFAPAPQSEEERDALKAKAMLESMRRAGEDQTEYEQDGW